MVPISYNVRSLWVRKANTLATALGIALVVFVLSSSQMLARGLERTMGRSGSDSNAFVLRKGADAELSSAIEQPKVSLIKAAPGVKRGADGQPLGVGDVVLVLAMSKRGGTEGQVANVMLRGVEPDVLAFRKGVKIIEGRPARPGTDEVIIGKRLVGQYEGTALGERFVLNKNRHAEVVGVFEAGGSAFESEVWCDIETARTAFGRENIVSSVTVALASPSKFEAFKQAMAHDKQLGLQAMRESEYYEQQSEGTAMFVSVMGGVIVFFFSIGAMVGAMITMYAAVQNRRREIGILRALGFRFHSILASFLLESVVLALTGGALGAVASLAMGMVEFSMMNAATWSELTFNFEPAPDILVVALAAGGVMGLIGGFFPALNAARLSPIAAMRD